MDHYYKYEGLSEEDRNGLIPFMHVPEALRIDPEDCPPLCDTQPKETRQGRRTGARNGYVRKTRDEYMLMADLGNGLGLQPTGLTLENWEEMKAVLQLHRKAWPENRYSYRKRRIKIAVN